ncbi:hypothetical protein BH23ACT2_BH23ACT2_28390 [soil metagenome]
MSDPIESTETTADEPVEPDTADEPVEPGTEAEESPNREAARWRRQLRDAEADRDRLAATVESYQRGEVERLAADRLASPGDLWAAGTNLADLVGEDGQVDADAVHTVAKAILVDRPHWAKPPPRFPPATGQGRREAVESAPSWQDALRGGRR